MANSPWVVTLLLPLCHGVATTWTTLSSLVDRLVQDDSLTSINIKDYNVEVRETKLGPEIVTRDIPNVSEESLRHLDENGIVQVGSEVKAGDVLVGKITPKGEQELSSEERLLRAIFGEKAKDVRDTSQRMNNAGGGKVVGVKIFCSRKRP